MLDTAARLLATFSQLPDNGINAIAAQLPLEKLGGGFDPAPRTVTTFVDVDIGGIDPPQVPACIFWVDSSVDIEMKGTYRIGKQATLAMAYVTDGEESEPVALSESALILRAAQICFRRFNQMSVSSAYREHNGIRIMSIEKVTEQRVVETDGRRKLWGFLYIPVIVVDTLT